MSIEISAVICTYNRADILIGALDSLCQQTLPSERYEIIVVDNASTDTTTEVVHTFIDKYPTHHIRRLYEARQGKGYACNAVLTEAKGNYIAYMDDDARAKNDWLEVASRHLTGLANTQCLGGSIKPYYTSDKPTWFKDQYESRTWGDIERHLEHGESFSGSNMIWRKETLQAIGGFGETLGPKGKEFSVGEDTMAFRRLWRLEQDPVVIYDPVMIVYHWVPPLKMKVSYYLKRAFVTGQAAIQLDGRLGLFGRLGVWLRSGCAVGLYMVRAAVRLPQYRRWQNWIVEEWVPVASKVGNCLAACGIMFAIKQK